MSATTKAESSSMARKRTNLWMMLVVLIIGVVSIRWAEKLPVGDGFGWDGVLYATWAKDFHKSVFVDRLSDYYVQRLAPSAIVHYGARALLWPFYSSEQSHSILTQNKNVMLSLGVYNLILLLLAVYTWGLIADNLNLTDKGKWFGFCALFVNYAIAKSNFYQPVLTDTTAFTLGMLMFYFFLTRKSIGLLAVMIIGCFTWPSIPFMAALLLIFPRPDDGMPEARFISPAVLKRFSLFVSGVACGVVALAFAYLLWQDLPRQWDKVSMVRIDFTLLYSSIALVLVYLFFGFRAAFIDNRLFDLRYIRTGIRWKWAAVAALVLFLWRLVVHQIATATPSSWNSGELAKYIFVSSLTEPLIFVVAHAVYYGPAILLLLIFWRPFCESAGQYGIGFRLFVILNLCLSICPQSRYQIPYVSAFAIVLVTMLDRSVLHRWNLTWWILLSIFYSKMWYTFNTAPMNPDGTMAVFQTFPLQHFFGNSGPWMSKTMYLIQGGVVLATAIMLYFLVARKPAHPTIFPQRQNATPN